MFNDDPDSNIGFLLHDVSRLLRVRFDRRARALGLTRAQWRVLAHLAPRQGINQSNLAEILEVETITLGRHIIISTKGSRKLKNAIYFCFA